MLKTVIVIPARLHSTRLPEKALAMIEGKTLIQRVYEQAKKCRNAGDVIVATDHDTIFNHLVGLGYTAVKTSPDHVSGTDRVAEAIEGMDVDVVINVQGDEPLIDPRQIDELIEVFQNPDVDIATQMNLIRDEKEVFDFSKVKVVTDIRNKVLYFSRQAIPAMRDLPFREWPGHGAYYKHVGIYGFRKKTLLEITRLPIGYLEKTESLEQLRWLENGYAIHCFPTGYESLGVDTPADLEKLTAIIKSMNA